MLALLSFKLSHEEVGIGGGHPCTHCCAVDLQVELLPKNKSILVQGPLLVVTAQVFLVLRASVHEQSPPREGCWCRGMRRPG